MDEPAFLESWHTVLNCHPALRAVFQWKDVSAPRQCVMPEIAVPVTGKDWRGISAEERTARLRAYLEEDRRQAFDFAQAPLMRLAVFRLAESEYQVLWTVHHLLADGRSLQYVLRQVFSCYEERKQRRRFALPAGPPFSAYVDWLQGQSEAEAGVFWRRHLSGLETPPSWPLPSPSHSGVVGVEDPGRISGCMNGPMTASLEQLADRHGLTMNIVLLGAWALLLHRYSGSEDLVLGAVKNVRHGSAAPPEAVGVYINTLPVRTRMEAGMRLIPWLRALRDQWVSFRAFEHTAPDKIHAYSGLAPGAPLFEFYYVFERRTLEDSLRAFGGAWLGREIQLFERTPVPMMLAGHGGETLRFEIEYDTRRVDGASVARMSGHLQVLLEGMAADPDRALEELPLLTGQEQRQLLFEWQPPATAAPSVCVHQLAQETACRTPDAPAVRFKDACLSYGELEHRSNQLAHDLIGRGVVCGARVGICLPRSIDMIVGLLGILKAGGTCVPLDLAYPAERMEFILSDSEASVLVTQRALLSRLERISAEAFCMDEESGRLATLSGESPAHTATPDQLAYIIYTSGSTGKPKGVCVAHREAACHFITIGGIYGIRPGERILQFGSLSFDVSFEEIFATLIMGGTLVIADPRLCPPAFFSEFLRDERIAVANLAPAFWQPWIDEGVSSGRADFGPQFRLLIVGSDVVLLDAVQRWQRSPATRHVRLMNAYGPTETVITATLFEIPERFEGSAGRVPIGRPIPGTEAYLLDRHGNPVPVGVVGELYIGGNRLARGYLNRPELTAQRFVPHPFRAQGKLYRTGDLASYLPDGVLEYHGRIDDQVKIRGFRIELGEIEIALRENEGVSDAVVRNLKDAFGEARLVAYWVPDPVKTTDAKALRASLRVRLPDYMVPSAFVRLESIPLTTGGKVDYRALPAPEEKMFLSEDAGRVDPRTDTERAVANIWQEVLGANSFGVFDSFFDLGGHSLRAAQVVYRVRETLGAEVPLDAFFSHPTVEGIARIVETALSEYPPEANPALPGPKFHPCVVELRGAGKNPPLFCALGAGSASYSYGALASHLDSEQPVYGLRYSHLSEHREIFRVEAVAQRYLEAIRSVQPSGPYYLAGWSFGGLAAYEMAQRLREQGEEVALLAIIDCEARIPGAQSFRHWSGKARQWIWRTAERIKIILDTREVVWIHACDLTRLLWKSFRTPASRNLSIAEYLHFAKSDVLRAYAMRKAGMNPAEFLLSRLDMAEDGFVRRVVAGARANEQAAKEYRMTPYGGRITLFRTQDNSNGYHDESLGYRRLAAEVRVERVDGNHLMLMRDPYVEPLARKLQQCLDAARK